MSKETTMHLSIIRDSNQVTVGDVSLIIDLIDIPEHIRAVHWLNNEGWIDMGRNGQTSKMLISNVDDYQIYIDRHAEIAGTMSEEELAAVTNIHIKEAVDAFLIECAIMRDSDEWIEFKDSIRLLEI